MESLESQSIGFRAARGFALAVLTLVLIASTGCAALGAPSGEVIQDDWATVSLAGVRIGYVHTITERRTDPEPVIATSVFNETRIQRFGAKISFRTDIEFVENERGELISTRMRMAGPGMQLETEAALAPDKAVVTTHRAGQEVTREYPLDEPVLGPYAESRKLAQSGFGAGTEVTFKTFVPDQQRVATSTIQFQGRETVEINGVPMELHKAIVRQDIMPGIVVQAWIDDEGDTVRSMVDALGKIETVRTTREEALRAITPESLTDIADAFKVKSNARFRDSKEVTEAVYRIGGNPTDLEALDIESRRQTVLERGEDWIKLQVQAFPKPQEGAEAPGPEYLRPSLYLQSDDPKIIAAALKATEGIKSPWEKARALERWTNEYVNEKTYGVGFDSAKEVLLSREGDCTEHAVLLAALLRAAGVPSRVVVGITYWRNGFAYHMWTEAFVEGWTALDATLAEDFVDATHIALAATALDSPSATEPFLSLVNIVGKISVDVEDWSLKPGPKVLGRF
jgi:hypothetical protein